MRTKYLLLILSLVLVSFSCSISYKIPIQYSKSYPLYSTCVRKDGLWGEWDKHYSIYQTKCQYNDKMMHIYIYFTYSHPSEYYMKITIDKTARSDNGFGLFSSYKGSIEITEKNLIDNWLNDKGTYSGTILCDEDMDKAIQQNGVVGTLNVLYGNNLGRGFTFWQDKGY